MFVDEEQRAACFTYRIPTFVFVDEAQREPIVFLIVLLHLCVWSSIAMRIVFLCSCV